MNLHYHLSTANLRTWLDKFALERSLKYEKDMLDNFYKSYKEVAGKDEKIEELISQKNLSGSKIRSLIHDLIQQTLDLFEKNPPLKVRPESKTPSKDEGLEKFFNKQLFLLKTGHHDSGSNKILPLYDSLEYAVSIALKFNMFHVYDRVIGVILDEDNNPVFGRPEEALKEVLAWTYNQLLKQLSDPAEHKSPVLELSLDEFESSIKKLLAEENYDVAEGQLLAFWSQAERLVGAHTKVFFGENNPIERSKVDHLMIALEDTIESLPPSGEVWEILQAGALFLYLKEVVSKQSELKSSSLF